MFEVTLNYIGYERQYMSEMAFKTTAILFAYFFAGTTKNV